MYYLSGQGSYVISPEVGIIEMVFDRIDGSTACFEYIENEQFTQKYELSGTVADSGGDPKEGVAVSIASASCYDSLGIRFVLNCNDPRGFWILKIPKGVKLG